MNWLHRTCWLLSISWAGIGCGSGEKDNPQPPSIGEQAPPEQSAPAPTISAPQPQVPSTPSIAQPCSPNCPGDNPAGVPVRVASQTEAEGKLAECQSQKRVGHWFFDSSGQYWAECCPLGQVPERTVAETQYHCRVPGTSPTIPPTPPTTDGMTLMASAEEASQKLAECVKQNRFGHTFQDQSSQYWFECCPAGQKPDRQPGEDRFHCR